MTMKGNILIFFFLFIRPCIYFCNLTLLPYLKDFSRFSYFIFQKCFVISYFIIFTFKVFLWQFSKIKVLFHFYVIKFSKLNVDRVIVLSLMYFSFCFLYFIKFNTTQKSKVARYVRCITTDNI